MDDDDDIPTYPDDPNHPHVWGRPFELSPEAAIRAREMMNGPIPEWFNPSVTEDIERLWPKLAAGVRYLRDR